MAEAKMITMSMLMNVVPFWAVTRAVLDPRTPTQTPQKRLDSPTRTPAQKEAKAAFSAI